MEIKEMIEVLKELYEIRKKHCGKIPPYETSKEAKSLLLAIELISKIRDAEMPKKNVCYHCKSNLMQDKATLHRICSHCGTIYTGDFINGYNQCHDDFLAYHLKKMSEKELE